MRQTTDANKAHEARRVITPNVSGTRTDDSRQQQFTYNARVKG